MQHSLPGCLYCWGSVPHACSSSTHSRGSPTLESAAFSSPAVQVPAFCWEWQEPCPLIPAESCVGLPHCKCKSYWCATLSPCDSNSQAVQCWPPLFLRIPHSQGGSPALDFMGTPSTPGRVRGPVQQVVGKAAGFSAGLSPEGLPRALEIEAAR